MSRRCLVFTEEQVYWVCQKARYSEDRHAESPFVSGIVTNGPFEDYGGDVLMFDEHMSGIYQDLVPKYSSRTFKIEEDYFHGFLGVAKVLTKLTGIEFFWHLPLSNFTYSLCWCPLDLDDEIDRRRGSHLLMQEDGTSVRHPLPSWSWVGWYCELRWPPESEGRRSMASLIQSIESLHSSIFSQWRDQLRQWEAMGISKGHGWGWNELLPLKTYLLRRPPVLWHALL